MSQLLDSLGANPAWSVQGAEKTKYENIFESLGPVAGKLAGDKVRPVLLNSKLSMDVLGRVWELSDIDKDGFLDKEEFCVAMHLVYRAIDKEPVPITLPLHVIPPSKRIPTPSTNSSVPTTTTANRHLPGAVAVLPPMPASPAALTRHDSTASAHSTTSPQHSIALQTSTPPQWTVSAADRARFNGIFQKSKDPDNYISGVAARNVFVQSGLPQNILAHVWTMCDQQSTGRLSQDQFVIAMHLISQKVKGIDLPPQITPQMLSTSGHDSGYGDTGSLSDTSSGVGDSAAMRELDALNQEIEELRKEKESLTTEIRQKELAIHNTDHDVQELQDKLDRDSSSLAQLECDKAEAHTRLEELEQQRNKLDSMLADVRLKVQEESETIKSLRAQISAQEASVSQQEVELRRVRNELSELKKEETQFEQRLEAERQQHQTVERTVKDTQAEIDKVKGQLKSLQEQRRSVSSNIEQYDKAVAAIKSESKDDLTFDPPSVDMTVSDGVFKTNGTQDNMGSGFHGDPFSEGGDPFKNSDPFSAGGDPFGGSDPFSSNAPASTLSADPFSSNAPVSADPFSSNAPVSALSTDPFSSNASVAATEDPFSGTDPFKPSAPDNSASSDPFQATDPTFGFSADQFTTSSNAASDPFGGQDPFTSNKPSAFDADPFASSDAFPTDNKSTFDAGAPAKIDAFAKAFSDTALEKSELFPELGAFPSSDQKTSGNPWGGASAFGGGSSGNAGDDPFGDAFGSDPFSSGPDKGSKEAAAPPRPAKSPLVAGGPPSTAPQKLPKLLSEADQLNWAKAESKKAEEERLRKQRQEEADLELAIALSKQQG